jgi:hypothetical protein
MLLSWAKIISFIIPFQIIFEKRKPSPFIFQKSDQWPLIGGLARLGGKVPPRAGHDEAWVLSSVRAQEGETR